MSDWFAGLPTGRISREPLPVRRASLGIMMLSAAVFLAAVACGGQDPVSAPVAPAPAPATPPHVVFFAEGDGTASGAITIRSESGGPIQKDVALPMHNTETGEPGISSDQFKRGDFLYLSLQNSEPVGSVTCRIEVTVDGEKKVIDKATSTGAYKVVTCQGKVP